MKLDIAAERERLQAMRDNPQSSLERAIKKDWLENGSNPREWSDETVHSCVLACRVYEMGWKAGRDSATTAPAQEAAPMSEQKGGAK